MTDVINCIRVACDSRHVRSIAITCKCGHRWQERLTKELHDAKHMACEFDCTKCGQTYVLLDKKLIRKEHLESHDRQEQPSTVKDGQARDKFKYDA